MKKSNKRNITYLIIFVLIVGIVWFVYYNDNFRNTVTNSISESFNIDSKNINALSSWKPEGTVIYLNDNEISYQPMEKDAKIYTPTTLNAVYQSTEDGSLLIVTDENKLTVWRDGKIVKEISSDNNYNPLPVLSPDAGKMAVIAFSNAERDYGYILQTFSTDNEYIGDVYKSSNPIIAPHWKDNENIIFAINSDTGCEIFLANITDGKSNLIYSTNGKYITSLAVRNDKVIVVAGNEAGSDSKQTIYNLSGDSLTDLTKKKGYYHEVFISPDSQNFVYINAESEIIIQSISDRNSKSIGKASHIAGWIK